MAGTIIAILLALAALVVAVIALVRTTNSAEDLKRLKDDGTAWAQNLQKLKNDFTVYSATLKDGIEVLTRKVGGLLAGRGAAEKAPASRAATPPPPPARKPPPASAPRPAGQEEYINFDCTLCGQNIDAPATMTGQWIGCPTCKARINIPVRSVTRGGAGPGAPSALSERSEEITGDAAKDATVRIDVSQMFEEMEKEKRVRQITIKRRNSGG
ncbi:MAG: hypothetical protein V1873_04000 [Verrucomicrobiota bacterium]